MQIHNKTAIKQKNNNLWCKGCGHINVVSALLDTISKQLNPNKVVIVTDIGCIGMADSQFDCHTVHGLHGRAPAIAAGIAMTKKHDKVIVLMGDGGASIGIQHILECARLNINLLIIICNNQNYGMTGGQHSSFTLPGIKTTDNQYNINAFDIISLLAVFKVTRARIASTDIHLREYLTRCLSYNGFSLIETLNYCPSYTGKYNPGKLDPENINSFFKKSGQKTGFWESDCCKAPYFFLSSGKKLKLESQKIKFESCLQGSVRLLLAGSAGEGVQSAVEIFCQAAIISGLNCAYTGEYPVTVGKGFSAAYAVISREPILFTGSEYFDLALITSNEGYVFMEKRIDIIKQIVLDKSLSYISNDKEIEYADFRQAGSKQSMLSAIIWSILKNKYFPVEAVNDVICNLKDHLKAERFKKVFESSVKGFF